MKKNNIVLTVEQRAELERFAKTGIHSAKLIKRAEIVLLLDTSGGRRAVTFNEIARRLDVSKTTVMKVKADFIAASNVSTFTQRKKRATPPVAPKITGETEAHIIALACSKAPEGYARWTVRLIAEKSVELALVDSVSHMTIHGLLKKHDLSLT
jgi:hypothetical protein